MHKRSFTFFTYHISTLLTLSLIHPIYHQSSSIFYRCSIVRSIKVLAVDFSHDRSFALSDHVGLLEINRYVIRFFPCRSHRNLSKTMIITTIQPKKILMNHSILAYKWAPVAISFPLNKMSLRIDRIRTCQCSDKWNKQSGNTIRCKWIFHPIDNSDSCFFRKLNKHFKQVSPIVNNA